MNHCNTSLKESPKEKPLPTDRRTIDSKDLVSFQEKLIMAVRKARALLSEHVKTNCKIIMLSSEIHPKDINRIENNSLLINFMTKPLTVQALNDLRKMLMTDEKN